MPLPFAPSWFDDVQRFGAERKTWLCCEGSCFESFVVESAFVSAIFIIVHSFDGGG